MYWADSGQRRLLSGGTIQQAFVGVDAGNTEVNENKDCLPGASRAALHPYSTLGSLDPVTFDPSLREQAWHLSQRGCLVNEGSFL